MSEHTPAPDLSAPLDGVTVVDMTTPLGEYTGRLLADLGAEVIRVDTPASAGSPHRRAFMNAGKTIRPSAPSAAELDELLGRAQILITSEGPAALRSKGLDPTALTRRHRMLVHLAISPFGLDGPVRRPPRQ